MCSEEDSPRWTTPKYIWKDGCQFLNPEGWQYDNFFHDFVVGFGRLIFKRYRHVSGMEHHKVEDLGMYYIPKHPTERRRCWCPILHDESNQGSCPFLTYQPGPKARLFNQIGLGSQVRPCPDKNTCHSAIKESRHECRNVVHLAYNYMYWLVKYRVSTQNDRAIRDGTPKDIEDYLKQTFRNCSIASGDDDGSDYDPFWLWRKAAVCGLVWELKNPRESRSKDAEPPSDPWDNDEAWVHKPMLSLGNGSVEILLQQLFNAYASAFNFRDKKKIDVESVELWKNVMLREMKWMSVEGNKNITQNTRHAPFNDNPEAENIPEEPSRRDLKRSISDEESDDKSLNHRKKKQR